MRNERRLYRRRKISKMIQGYFNGLFDGEDENYSFEGDCFVGPAALLAMTPRRGEAIRNI
jgi:hypothetical protein